MRRGLLSLGATALAIPVLLGVVLQSYPIEVAAIRLLVLTVAVLVIDRVVAPAMTIALTVVRGNRPDVAHAKNPVADTSTR